MDEETKETKRRKIGRYYSRQVMVIDYRRTERGRRIVQPLGEIERFPALESGGRRELKVEPEEKMDEVEGEIKRVIPS